MDLEFLENLQEKNPRIIAEYFFENYEYHEVNKLVKQIQKKIMEKNNSLKLMLSHRYVDLLDCSELIENLKHYSNKMSGIAERNAENIKNSLNFISEKKAVPTKVIEPKKIGTIDRCILLQRKALELSNRDLEFGSLTEKIYFIILFLINSEHIKSALDSSTYNEAKGREYEQNSHQLKDLLTDCFARLLSSLNQFVASVYTYDRKEVLVSVLGVVHGIHFLASDNQCRTLLEEVIEDLSLPGMENQGAVPQGDDIKAVLDFSFLLVHRMLEKGLDNVRDKPAKTLNNFLRVIRDFLWMLSEESDGFVIKKIDEALQSSILNSQVFRALVEDEEQGFQRISGIFELDAGVVIVRAYEHTKEFVNNMMPKIESVIRSNTKIESKFNGEFLNQTLWENDQKELLNALSTKHSLELPRRMEEIFRIEWKNYSEYYIKKIIEDFSIKESFSFVLKAIFPYLVKLEDIYSKKLSTQKLNKSLREGVDIAKFHWEKSAAEYDEFWNLFDTKTFQSFVDLEYLEKIISDALLGKVTAVDNDFRKIFFENIEVNVSKRYILVVILINYLELTHQILAETIKNLKRKDLFEKLLQSLCEKIYQSIERDSENLVPTYISNENNTDGTGDHDDAKASQDKKSFKVLAKMNKKLLQLQLDNINHPKYIIRFKDYIKAQAQRLISSENTVPQGDGQLTPENGISRGLVDLSTNRSSTYPLKFYYFMDGAQLEGAVKTNNIQKDQKSQAKKKTVNIRDTLFLEKLSVDQNEFLNDYTLIPIQKFTLKKKVETTTHRSTRRIESTDTSSKSSVEDNISKQGQFGLSTENIDIAGRAKNIVGGMFNKFLKK